MSTSKAVGRQYVSDQVESDHFRDWYQDQLVEGERLSREGKAAAGLETWNLVKLPNAKRLAARMLQQLGWDMDRDLSVRTIHQRLKATGVKSPESREAVLGFAEGVKAALKSSAVQSWLGDENQVLGGGAQGLRARRHEARGQRAPESRRQHEAILARWTAVQSPFESPFQPSPLTSRAGHRPGAHRGAFFSGHDGDRVRES